MTMEPKTEKIETLDPYFGQSLRIRHLTLPMEAFAWGLHTHALLVYCLLMNRMKLSRKNGWADEEGAVYVHYSVRSMADDLRLSQATVKRMLRQLEERGLLRRTCRGEKAVRYYLYFPASWLGETEKQPRPDRPAETKPPMDPGDLDWLLEEMEREKRTGSD